MSDLQCPATFLLLPDQPVPSDHAASWGELVRALAAEHVAEVVSGSGAACAALADVLAAQLGLRRAPLYEGHEGHDGPDVRDQTGTGPATVPALEEVADLHRGERVVAVLAPADLEAVLQVARRSPATPAVRSAGGWTEVAVDADGWVLRATP